MMCAYYNFDVWTSIELVVIWDTAIEIGLNSETITMIYEK